MDVMAELNKLSIYKPLTEDQVRSIVGAPSLDEEQYCTCGKLHEDCPDNYEHMTHGV
jgi:hypothetical protein